MLRPTAITGAAGEHYAMYQLLRRGFVAALAPPGVPNVDILVSDQNGAHLASLQVKTMGSPGKKWQLNEKQETLDNPSLFYCFLRPRDEFLSGIECWVMPSSVVAEHVRLSHAAWLRGAPLRGSSRADSSRRSMHFECEPHEFYRQGWMDKYSENWELLRG